MNTMLRAAIALGLFTGAAMAQPAGTTGNAPASVSTTGDASRSTATTPAAGANSFTEGQARGRIQDRGYTQVMDLKKDDQGVWRGMAMKDGKTVPVAVDYQGNVLN